MELKDQVYETLTKQESFSFTQLKQALNCDVDDKKIHQALDQLMAEYKCISDEEANLYADINLKKAKVIAVYRDSVKLAYDLYQDELETNGLVLWPEDEVFVKDEKILCVYKHNLKKVSGLISYERNRYHFDPDIKLVEGYKIINYRDFKIKKKQLAVCQITSYEKKELKIIEILGNVYSLKARESALLHRYNLESAFNEKVLKEAEEIGDINTSEYTDLRDLLTVTIDGEDAKDYDDAIYVEKLRNKYCLYVLIADVSSYVKKGSELDKEALKRGTSIYYPEHVLPMLPERLSNDLCSLMPNKDRLSICCKLIYDEDSNLLNTELFLALMKSKKRLTYTGVNAYFNGEAKFNDSDLEKMLDSGKDLANKLWQKSIDRGYISFSSNESEFTIKEEKVVDVKLRESGIAEKMIEIFMIEANCAVANIMQENKIPALYRNHDAPNVERLSLFADLLYRNNYEIEDLNSNSELALALENFKDEDIYPVLSNLALRAMAKAKYSESNSGHYGLAREVYCHFTSPIRRYPDLFVHRMLHKYYFDSEAKVNENEKEIASICNERENMALSFERDMDDLLATYYMSNHLNEVYTGIVSSITSFGIYVMLENSIEGMIALRNLDSYFYLLDDNSLTDGRTTYYIGQKIKIRVINIDYKHRNIDFLPYNHKDGKRHLRKQKS